MTTATYRVLLGDALEQLRTLPDASVQTCVTSPPYFGLRSYLPSDHTDKAKEVGSEETPAEYVARLVSVFREVKRVLRDDGTLWLNLGDSYARNPKKGVKFESGSTTYMTNQQAREENRGTPIPEGLKEKDLLGIPWRVAFALQDDGWYLRSDIIWAKGSPMPESVKDRPTRSHEYIFLLSKQSRYYYDADAIAEPVMAGDKGSYFDKGKTALHPNQGKDKRDKQGQVGKRQYTGFNARWDAQDIPPQTRNRRDVWFVNTTGYPEAHFATFPEKLVEPMILAGCPEGGTVLDPFAGSGTTLAVANRLGRHAIGIELNPEYLPLIERRCQQGGFVFAEVTP